MDYFSKWLEVLPLQSKNSHNIINNLKIIFSTHGVPDELVADNVPYNSFECKVFAREWQFQIVTSSPHYPQSNGLAEKAVAIAKGIMRKAKDLSAGLLEYRTTPIIGVGLSPAQLLMSRNLKGKLPIVEDDLIPKGYNRGIVREKLEHKRGISKKYYDQSAKERCSFTKGENVVLQKGKEWVPARIEQKCNNLPRSYLVRDENNSLYRRNSKFVRKSFNEPNLGDNVHIENNDSLNPKTVEAGNDDCNINVMPENTDSEPSINRPISPHIVNGENSEFSRRTVRIPVRFKDYKMYNLGRKVLCR